MKVYEVMTRSPNCCPPHVSARMAADVLAQFDVGILPVVEDLENRKLVGVITDRDLCNRILAPKYNPDEVAVRDCMTKDPVCCTAEMELEDVLELIARHGLRRIPVVDPDNRLLGIVSVDDLIRLEALSPVELCAALRRGIRARTQHARVTVSGI